METQLLHENINGLRDKNKPRSHKTDKLLVQLRDKGLEILSSQLDGQTVVVWMRCHSQTAIGNLQRLYESNKLRDEYFENLQASISKFINIDWNQFKKTVFFRTITVNFTQRIELQVRSMDYAQGVTKLRNKIYILGTSDDFIPKKGVSVFEDRYPFRLQTDIKIEEINDPLDIGSSEKENCLYVRDFKENCVWKITRETDDTHKIIKWLTTDYEPFALSVSRDGELLMINLSTHSLMMYGSDAELIRSIPLTRVIKNPHYAVETPLGNFLVVRFLGLEDEEEEEENGEKDERKDEDGSEDEVAMEERKHTKSLESRERKGGSNRRMHRIPSVISELTRDGQMVIRRFIPSDETQQLIDCDYVFIDSDDRVFAADSGNARVSLLDSDIKWNRILCPTKEENEEQNIILPYRLFYDEEMKQLIVGGFLQSYVNVYTLSLS